MILTIYIFILSYFLLGAIGFYLINRKKEKAVARKSWTKFITYFVIIHVLFFSIVINPRLFQVLVGLILLFGAFELLRLYIKHGYRNSGFVLLSLVIYAILGTGLWLFSAKDSNLVLFAFLILSIFDAFSQISGQLWGKTKIAPKISPNKTIGGTVGGGLFALASGFFLSGLYNNTWYIIAGLSLGIIVFAFLGDIAASLYKRKFGVKDYSNLIPGHGGFLDRFDSLIAGGAWVTLFFLMIG
ncbi:phosphatidate cytidylyltransferase [Draconibacterium sp. IB214405]|uniref:phosphatidate cytidylyltransferase n=1 Tax=Draconibacterium sp. IB214405 TaxID=3097352 RepID=UPI002A17F874|nr:phosphatidate cytidylyltransferase [Draconibacterium sp. IB214405]MDX8339959.1 phosphatidate cytidylyltransferase [Draconibacterium sp. IB214405]